jgi:hypothetical protein
MALIFRLTGAEQEVYNMNPFVTVWLKPIETIDRIKDSNWVNRAGLLPYLAAGINGVAESPYILERLANQHWFLQIVLSLGLVIIGAVVMRVIYVNLFFFVGKTLEGQATKRDVDTVLSLTMTTEFLKLAYLMIVLILSEGNVDGFESSNVLYFICSVLSLIIAIIGLRHVQKFAYKYVLLNVFMPMVLLAALIFMIL